MRKWKWVFVNGCEYKEPEFYRDEIFTRVGRWEKCIIVLWGYVEDNDTLAE
jgi:hypothetical protein